MALTTLLFDLDGTLLPLDLSEFFHAYFRAVLPHLAQFGDAKALQQAIVAATEATIANEDPHVTNLDTFKRIFHEQTSISTTAIWPIFDQFYADSFASLRSLTQPTNIAREMCRSAAEKGYRLVIATNPIFPEAAIRHRIDWAMVGDVPFDLVTTMEAMHFCKPNPKYFVEIMDKLDVTPDECMMFGNDVQEDGVAGKVGMQTYLVTDCLIDRSVGHWDFTHRSTLADALAFVRDLPAVAR